MTHEEVTLAAIVRQVLLFLGEREDAVLFGAQAVNAYCEPVRMTEDVDIASTSAGVVAGEVASRLHERFRIATRIREVPGGFRVYQVRKPKNRHLVDVRQVERLPAHRIIEGVRVVNPTELVAMKAISVVARQGREKELSDRLDLARLLRVFPELAANEKVMTDAIEQLAGDAAAVEVWRNAAASPLAVDDDVIDGE